MAQQRYHVIERIDAGGMAEVFKANSTSLQGFEKLVAIKRILPDLTKNERFVRMFLDEAKVSLHLNHTNCVQVFDLGLADGTYFIVMEYVDGTNLKNIIEQLKASRQLLQVEETAFIAIEICKGLAHAHNKRDQRQNHLAIVHRDISPPNVLISVEGEVKITDFGLAKAKSQVETTDPGIVKGKFGYLSPEAAHGEQVDARTDIFAVGIMMWEMLTGERLFLGKTDLETLQLVRKNQTPPLSRYRSDVPPAYEAIIRRALETDINKRYQTAEELATAIASFIFGFGKPVTNFQIARYVRAVRQNSGQKERTEMDRAVEEAIQQAVNRIVSLEEVDDLDLYLAETYGQIESGEDVWDGNGDFEDPSQWADFALDDVSIRKSPGEMGEAGDDWKARNLDELMRRRQTYPGGHLAAPKPTTRDEEPTIQMQSNALASTHRDRRPGEDIPLHERRPPIQPEMDLPLRPGHPAMTSPSGSVEIDTSMANHVQFVPAEPSRADRTGEMPAFSVPGPSKSKDSKTPTLMIVGIVVVLCFVAIVGFLLVK